MRGAGGTSGGTGHFILGFIMATAGLYLLLTDTGTQAPRFSPGVSAGSLQ